MGVIVTCPSTMLLTNQNDASDWAGLTRKVTASRG